MPNQSLIQNAWFVIPRKDTVLGRVGWQMKVGVGEGFETALFV
jgi:hypothetical protein